MRRGEAPTAVVPPSEPVTRGAVPPPPADLARPAPIRVSALLLRANRQATRLERAGPLLFVALSLAYWAVTCTLAARKLMWNDELYTYYVAALPSMRDVWAALLTGGEQTPPFFYLATRLSLDLFGANNISVRLPEMLGFWAMTVCLAVVVARRTTWFPALCAAALPLVTTAYPYAYEARAYGLVLGFAALALLSWQSATVNRPRVLWLVALAASLAAAVSTHYYAVFVVFSLACGEVVRTVTRRRADLAVWAALAAPAAALALHLPLIRAGQTYSETFWAPPQWISVPAFYEDLLAPAVVPVAVVLGAGVIHALAWADRSRPFARERTLAVPLHEIAAACGFVLIPLVSVIVAKVATGAFVNRYALPAVIGFAVFAGLVAAAAFARHPFMRLVTVACLAGWFVLGQAREYLEPSGFSLPVSRTSIDRAEQWLRAAPREDLPFVVADPHTFAVLSHYGAPEVRSRMVYLADPALALRHLGHNSVERGMLDLLRPWFAMNVADFEPFYARHQQFLVYGDFLRLGFLNWMLPELQARGVHLQLLNREGDNLFLLATREGHPTGARPAAASGETARRPGAASASAAR